MLLGAKAVQGEYRRIFFLCWAAARLRFFWMQKYKI